MMDTAGLPPTLSTEQAAQLLGISTDLAYELVRRGEAPVEPLRLGRRLRWPTARLLAVLGLERDTAPGGIPEPSQVVLHVTPTDTDRRAC